MYKNIFIGTNMYFPDWIKPIQEFAKTNSHIFLRDVHKLQINEVVVELANIHYILPMSDTDFDFITSLTKNKPITIPILYPTKDTQRLLHDKVHFTNFMMEHFSTYIPKVYYLENIYKGKKEKERNKEEEIINFPVIYKPRFSTNGKGMKIFMNDKEFHKYFKENKKEKTIIQQFIDDPYEYSVYMLCIQGSIMTWKVIRCEFKKYFIKKTNFPPNYENVTEHFPIQLFAPIFQQLNYSGGACIDFKFNPITQHLSIFEINPRFGGSAFSHKFIGELLSIPICK